MLEITWAMIFKGGFCLSFGFWMFYAMLKENEIAKELAEATILFAIAALINFAMYAK